MIRAIAIDDEPFALEVIKKHAEKIPFLILEHTFINAFDAINYLVNNDVDLLFLDINMPDISGIELYNSLSRKPLIIFTTAYSEHAVTGFELEALDYLLKPFTFTRFLKACNKALDTLSSKQQVTPYIFLKDGYHIQKVYHQDILFIEATGNYMRYVLTNKEILTRATLKETTDLLPSTTFFQIHRSFIVNENRIDKIERHQISIGAYVVPIGSTYINSLKIRNMY
ncbi:LytTR family DNA-binding domain-containing protein [Sphingobacterium sp. UT-1RO-CII-1]|uniref:LytR/AlgR family response regulator transcription factor n=1 Tax=Sphingobacterium sp. UT-1RO-CII-1 TaxID=2995225 RepID=UPI00227A0089|nr:LytTR family DNA-binding domain-containing protein [Sphingobacterium sp. UT-1RO-CII-1]MCY4779305.1 LytTR family DNA-binding domain-containing protein [Sphingobacterium sp. UT-1RO-CII-1]